MPRLARQFTPPHRSWPPSRDAHARIPETPLPSRGRPLPGTSGIRGATVKGLIAGAASGMRSASPDLLKCRCIRARPGLGDRAALRRKKKRFARNGFIGFYEFSGAIKATRRRPRLWDAVRRGQRRED
jgi:hypothetical protein